MGEVTQKLPDLLGAHFKLVASFIVAIAARLASNQLQAWIRTLGDTDADTCFGLVRSPKGSIAVGLLTVAETPIAIRRYSSDGTQTFEGSDTNLRGLDMITDGSSNTIFVGERANGRLVVGKYAINGSLSYTTEVMLPSGVDPASARLVRGHCWDRRTGNTQILTKWIASMSPTHS